MWPILSKVLKLLYPFISLLHQNITGFEKKILIHTLETVYLLNISMAFFGRVMNQSNFFKPKKIHILVCSFGTNLNVKYGERDKPKVS